jgi:DNA invertase Pin-like site-specific DNA recombinase
MSYSAFRRRSRAQKRGQRMGRKGKLTEPQQAEARRRRAQGATLAELARGYGVGKSTISRLSDTASDPKHKDLKGDHK